MRTVYVLTPLNTAYHSGRGSHPQKMKANQNTNQEQKTHALRTHISQKQ